MEVEESGSQQHNKETNHWHRQRRIIKRNTLCKGLVIEMPMIGLKETVVYNMLDIR